MRNTARKPKGDRFAFTIFLVFVCFIGSAFAGNSTFFPSKTAIDTIWSTANDLLVDLAADDVNLSTGSEGIKLDFKTSNSIEVSYSLKHPSQSCSVIEIAHSHAFLICGSGNRADFDSLVVERLQNLDLSAEEAWVAKFISDAGSKPRMTESNWPYDFILSILALVFLFAFGFIQIASSFINSPKERAYDLALFALAVAVRASLPQLEPGVYNIRLIALAQPAATCQSFNLHACGNEAWQYLVFMMGNHTLPFLGAANLIVSSLLVPLTRVAVERLFSSKVAGLSAAIFILVSPLMVRFGYSTEPVSLAVLTGLVALVLTFSNKRSVWLPIWIAIILGLSFQIRSEMLLAFPWITYFLLKNKKGTLPRWSFGLGFLVLMVFVLPHLLGVAASWKADHADEWHLMGREHFIYEEITSMFFPTSVDDARFFPHFSLLLLPVFAILTAWKRTFAFYGIVLGALTELLPYIPYGFSLSKGFGFLHYFPAYMWVLSLFYGAGTSVLFSLLPSRKPYKIIFGFIFGCMLLSEILLVRSGEFLKEKYVIHEEVQFIMDTAPTLPKLCSFVIPPANTPPGPLQPHPLQFGLETERQVRYFDLKTDPSLASDCLVAYSGAICSMSGSNAVSKDYCLWLQENTSRVLIKKMIKAVPVVHESYMSEEIELAFVLLKGSSLPFGQ